MAGALVVRGGSLASAGGRPLSPMLSALASPDLFAGDATTAYRDPAAIYNDGWFHLYFTLIKTESDGKAYSRVAWSKSRDLRGWTTPVAITPEDKSLEYGSPGDVVRFNDEWVLCLQTYPRPNGERYGNANSRIFTMRSRDLEKWDEPRLLRVKGTSVAADAMGRMIDPYLLRDKDDPGKWWCFFKQNGISMSHSTDLENWAFTGHTPAGENPCIVVEKNEYVLFHSPPNGIGTKRSTDLLTWRDEGITTLGQSQWPWAQGRITAGFVLDLRDTPAVGKALMFFHGSRFPENDARGGFDNFASLGVAWSDDLKYWQWPGSTALSG